VAGSQLQLPFNSTVEPARRAARLATEGSSGCRKLLLRLHALIARRLLGLPPFQR
jgi:hypothetical protein